jgi:hypothetical protein
LDHFFLLKDGRVTLLLLAVGMCVTAQRCPSFSAGEASYPQRRAPIFVMSAFCFSALTQPVALAIHFENVDMVGQSVEGGAGEAF